MCVAAVLGSHGKPMQYCTGLSLAWRDCPVPATLPATLVLAVRGVHLPPLRRPSAGVRSVDMHGPSEAAAHAREGEASTGLSSGSPTSQSSRQGSLFAGQPSADLASLPATDRDPSEALNPQPAAGSHSIPSAAQPELLGREGSALNSSALPAASSQGHGDLPALEPSSDKLLDAGSVAETDENLPANGIKRHQSPALVGCPAST